MNAIINIGVFIICSFIVSFAIKRVINGTYCIADFCLIVFYVMQILPILVEQFYGIDDSLGKGTRFYRANVDFEVSIIYGIVMIGAMILLALLSKIHYKKYQLNYEGINRTIRMLKESQIFQVFLYFLMFCPVILVILAPNPMRYLTYTSIWKINQVGTIAERIYHNTVVYYGNNLALMAIIVKYFSKSHKSILYNIDIIIAIILMTWVDGKRALFIMAILGILIVDIVVKTYKNRPFVFIMKSTILLFIVIGFFFAYGNIVDKLQDSKFITNYTLYFGRMSSVKVSIYDMLHEKNILEYPGQTIIFDLFFYIPRSLWKNKPSMFTQYFTAYAINSIGFASWNLHVNMWTEMIANFGIVWGVVIGVLVTHVIAVVSLKSRSLICQMAGMIFLILYYMFGFEIILMILFAIWIMSLILSRFKVEDRTIKFIIHR